MPCSTMRRESIGDKVPKDVKTNLYIEEVSLTYFFRGMEMGRVGPFGIL